MSACISRLPTVVAHAMSHHRMFESSCSVLEGSTSYCHYSHCVPIFYFICFSWSWNFLSLQHLSVTHQFQLLMNCIFSFWKSLICLWLCILAIVTRYVGLKTFPDLTLFFMHSLNDSVSLLFVLAVILSPQCLSISLWCHHCALVLAILWKDILSLHVCLFFT